MRQNAALDIAVFQDFDAVHACLPVQVALGRQCGVFRGDTDPACDPAATFERRTTLGTVGTMRTAGDTVDSGIIGRPLW